MGEGALAAGGGEGGGANVGRGWLAEDEEFYEGEDYEDDGYLAEEEALREGEAGGLDRGRGVSYKWELAGSIVYSGYVVDTP